MSLYSKKWAFGKYEHAPWGGRQEIVNIDGLIAIVDCEEGDMENAHVIKASLDLMAACEAFISRTYLTTRWPCPDCGRAWPDDPKRSIELKNGNIIGCWLCHTDDTRDVARAAIARARG